MQPGFPTTAEAITPAWLTEVLRASGALEGGSVASFTAAPVGVGEGFMSALRRLTIAYDGACDGAPRTVIAKLIPPDPGARQIDELFHFYDKEVGFYRLIAPSSPIRAPRAYHAAFDPATRDFVLLLEDLAPAVIGDQLKGLSFEEAALAVESIAAFHARWWQDPDLDGHDWMLAINSPELKALEVIYQQCWPAVLDFVGGRMSEDFKATGDRMATRVASLLDLNATRPRSAMHGDYRADNLFFGDVAGGGGLAVADWQILMKGNGAFDIAYLLSGSLTVDMRRGHEMDLLRLYHRTLEANGVAGYSFEDCFSDYRLNVMLGWAWPVTAIGTLDTANERGVALFNSWADRAMAAVIDLDAAAMLPA